MSDPTQPNTPPPVDPAQQEEFVRLLNGAHSMLLRYIVSFLSSRPDAEDVLQRASVTMWRRFSTFEQGSDFVAWATTIAFYEVRNFQRVTNRSRLEFSDALVQTLANERGQDIRKWDRRFEALERCVQKLDPASRTLVDALYSGEMTAGDLASKQGKSIQSIYNKISGIRRALAECVQKQLVEVNP
jgi:RNA polymerase sigma-70 factor (ECF subfamily)